MTARVPRGAARPARVGHGRGSARRRASLRARADAILVGRGTVIDDDPLLTCRLPGLEARSPVRIVLARALAGPPLRRKSINTVILQFIDDECGPLIWPRITEQQQNSFDSTCRKLYQFLVASRS